MKESTETGPSHRTQPDRLWIVLFLCAATGALFGMALLSASVLLAIFISAFLVEGICAAVDLHRRNHPKP